MDVDDIPEELIFTPIPLEARLSKGTKSVVNLAQRQREVILEETISASSNYERPPEARLAEISPSGSLKLRFTKKINFSEDLKEKISNSKEQRRQLQQIVDEDIFIQVKALS